MILLLAACREAPAPRPRASADPTPQTSAAPPPATSTPPAATPASSVSATAPPAPPPAPPPAVARPPRPTEAPSPTRACKKDDDCDLVPDDCKSCPPCAATWRKAANKATVQRMVDDQRRSHCPPISCRRCEPEDPPPGQPRVETGYIGDKAVCDKGQCTVE